MMATTVSPEPFMRPTPSPAFDSNPDHLAASMSSFADSSLRSQPPRGGFPPPNPHFVFPAQPPPLAPPTLPRTTGRRPMSAIESPTRSFGLSSENDDDGASRSALPVFTFNPGASLPADPRAEFLLSPPISPRNGPSAHRPAGHGHRRGGSEFVGGRLREGNSIAVMSTSPTKPESGFNPSSLQPPRRGHRRGVSGAISTNDLPILQPPVFDSALNRGSSAPTSPTAFGPVEDKALASCLDTPKPTEPVSEPVPEPEMVKESPKVSPQSSPEGSPKQNKAGNKARVGFSDTLEFIPRPLSLVSTETSSTMTVRPGHGVSGSISSVLSGAVLSGRNSPAPIEEVPLSRTSTRDPSDSRPSTAGAILERTQNLPSMNTSPRRRNSIPTLIHLAEASKAESAEPSPSKTPKRWSFFTRETSSNSSLPLKVRPHSSSSSESVAKGSSSEHGSESGCEATVAAPAKSKKASKKNKKKKKVKGWAGAILPKKPKGHSKKSKVEADRPPTPPAAIVPHDYDENEDVLMEDPELLEPSPMPTVTITESADPPEEEPKKRSEEESTYPMIDLDAALGPFNTPLPLNPEWEAAQRAAGNVTSKRRLHSAQGMKGFSGPGMHYHRRAESAPDLPPFDPGRAGIHRFNSSSTMADVFEEEEEDLDKSKSAATQSENDVDSDSDATPPAAIVNDPMLDVQDKSSVNGSVQSMRRTNSGLSDREPSTMATIRAERSRSSLHDSVIVEDMPSVIFRSPNMLLDRTDTSESGSPSIRRFSGNNDLAPVDIGTAHIPAPPQAPNSPYAISHASSFPSPRSPMSMDVQHISTAPSSIADENNFQSLLLMGEPGPEVRISMDYDIPSLTSSNSTMTRDSMFIPGQRMSQPMMREPRPVSVSSAAFGRRRSSLASLSRLISSSHGERSKLSMEVRIDSEPITKKAKSSRTKRLSRMMQFWKPQKENNSQ